MEQELIIIGYTNPQGSRTDFGALLVGYYQNKKLLFAIADIEGKPNLRTFAVAGKCVVSH